jgi:hypothetical protein
VITQSEKLDIQRYVTEGREAQNALKFMQKWRAKKEREVLDGLRNSSNLPALQSQYKAYLDFEEDLKKIVAKGEQKDRKLKKLEQKGEED